MVLGRAGRPCLAVPGPHACSTPVASPLPSRRGSSPNFTDNIPRKAPKSKPPSENPGACGTPRGGQRKRSGKDSTRRERLGAKRRRAGRLRVRRAVGSDPLSVVCGAVRQRFTKISSSPRCGAASRPPASSSNSAPVISSLTAPNPAGNSIRRVPSERL